MTTKMTSISDNFFSHENEAKLFQCALCAITLGSQVAMTRHLIRHSNQKPWKCSKCDKTYAYKASLNRHVQTEHQKKRFSCKKCSRTYRQSAHLKIHEATAHSNFGRFRCSLCRESNVFKTQSQLRQHIAKIHGEVVNDRNEGNLEESRYEYLMDFLPSPVDVDRMQELPGELDRPTPPGTFRPIGQPVIVKPTFQRAKLHCQFCYQEFATNWTLIRHINAKHSGMPMKMRERYCCKQCQTSFSSHAALIRHQKIIHERQRKWQCAICMKVFARRYVCHAHIKNVHGPELQSLDPNVWPAPQIRDQESYSVVYAEGDRGFVNDGPLGYQNTIVVGDSQPVQELYKSTSISQDVQPGIQSTSNNPQIYMLDDLIIPMEPLVELLPTATLHTPQSKLLQIPDHTTTGTIQCDVCGQYFLTAKGLKQHTTLKHTSDADLRITIEPVNQNRTTAPTSLTQNPISFSSTSTHITKYHCVSCTRTFKSRNGYSVHKRVYKTHQCSCRKILPTKCAYAAHTQKCEVFARAPPTRNIKSKFPHIKISTDMQLVISSAYEDVKKKNLLHKMTPSETILFEVNDQALEMNEIQKSNMTGTSQDDDVDVEGTEERKKPKQKLSECKTCGAEFTRASDLKRHMNRHLGVKPIKCEFCEKRYNNKSQCNQHVRMVHKKVFKVSCHVCHKEFANKSSLKVHMRQHVPNSESYPCTFCGKKFMTCSEKQRHLKSCQQSSITS